MTANLKAAIEVRLDLNVPDDTTIEDVVRAFAASSMVVPGAALPGATQAAIPEFVVRSWHRRAEDGSFTGKMG